jgi:hypothetical protein
MKTLNIKIEDSKPVAIDEQAELYNDCETVIRNKIISDLESFAKECGETGGAIYVDFDDKKALSVHFTDMPVSHHIEASKALGL